ncbi:MAG: hypothetical protein CMJ23_02985 [Phycisphaerae bacterium]|nr:hypothetical protein [Phycisphaerae bacterium]
MSIHRHLFVLAAFLVAVSAGCSSQDPVGVRLTLDDSGAGTVSVAALSLPEATVDLVDGSEKVKWDLHARLDVITGKFTSADGLTIEDFQVNTARFGKDGGSMRLLLPCGKDARWFQSLHVASEDRARLQDAMGYAIQEVELHENITITVEIKGARVAGSLISPVPRVAVTSKKATCTMVVPIDILESRREPMNFVVNWEWPRPVGGDSN